MRVLFVFFLSCLFLFTSCENKRKCPFCSGAGEVLVEGSMRECVVCHGEKEVDDKTYENFFKAMEHLQNSGNMTAPYNSGRGGEADGEPTAVCPMCSGSGVFSFYGEYHPCSECNQTGRVTPERAVQLQQSLQELDQMTGGGGYGNTSIQYGSSPNDGDASRQGRGSSGNDCHTCGGTGDCTYCHGAKVVEYDGEYGEPGGFMKCPVCKGNGRCGVCNGYGSIR